ncbi:MAG: c-type cytochrome biogenesis protein CcsB [Thermodesulfobacteriota bacterium]|nr:c-type cytochrome biogenesis protein CcsB [Thermodesulfobacteriota bacterium]
MHNNFPVISFAQSLAFFSWLITSFFLYILFKYRIQILGALLVPVALILFLTGTLSPEKTIIQVLPYFQKFSLWLPVHTTFCFTGNAAFAVASCLGIIYLIQEKYIKSKKIGTFHRFLPSLGILEELNYRCLIIGFPLLTLGIMSGAIWAQYTIGSYWQWDPKEVWSLITWFFYAAVLHGRLNMGWRGKKQAALSIIGFMVILFTFLGISFFHNSYHAWG